jgi:predicted nuclease of predicted toxin-antitoxin system
MKGFYFDEHMYRPVAEGLIARGYHVTMAADVGMKSKDDDTEHLPYAAENDLILVTFDRPFAGRAQSRDDHPGVICLSQSIRTQIGRQIEVLAKFADDYQPDSHSGQVHWLPKSN